LPDFVGRENITPTVEGGSEFERPDCRGYVEDYPGENEEREGFLGEEAGCDVDLFLARLVVR
jgi:hypothetical protein